MSKDDLSRAMRDAAEHALVMHDQELGLMPEPGDIGMMSACQALVRRGALTCHVMRHQDTGREGLGFRITASWLEQFRQIAREETARRGFNFDGDPAS